MCLERRSNEARIDGCAHTFCLECIDAWAKTTNRCPLCKREFTQIRRVGVPESVKRPRDRRKDGVPPEIVNVRKKRQLADYDDDEIERLVVSDAPPPPPPTLDDDANDADFTASIDGDDDNDDVEDDDDKKHEEVGDKECSDETASTDNDDDDNFEDSRSDFLQEVSDNSAADDDADYATNQESRSVRSSTRLAKKRVNKK